MEKKSVKIKDKTSNGASTAESTTESFPLREVHGGNYVHVPWSRGDLYSFTTNFPKLREEPEKWYKEVNRLAKSSKMLFHDLDLLFKMVVPTNLWKECKIAVTWPDDEPARTVQGLPDTAVQGKYDEVIKWLVEKGPRKTSELGKDF